jgi:Nif-specific regulatory protein
VSFIGLSINVDGRVRGVPTVDREWDGKPTFRLDEDVRMLTMVANPVGQAIRMQLLVVRDRDRLISEARRFEKQLSQVRETGRWAAAAAPGGKAVRHSAIMGTSPVMLVHRTASSGFCRRSGRDTYRNAMNAKGI